MKPKAQVEYRAIAELKELPGNPRTIKKDQFEKLKQSIKDNADYFEARPIILSDRTGELVILAGNQRYKAAKAIGLQQVPTILLPNLTEEREREIIIRDNVENGDWDWDELANAWDAASLTEWGVQMPDWAAEPDLEIIEDEAPEPPAEPKSKLGEIYQLGEHRLMCGDATNEKQVERLMDGVKTKLLLTDPPYGIDVVKGNKVGGDKAFGKVGGENIVKSKTYSAIIGDDTTDTARANYDVAITCSENQIIFGGNYFTDFLPPSRCWIVWDKQNTGNFADAELAWTSFDKGVRLYHYLWNGLCREGSREVEGKTRVHPTQKPVGMLASILKDFSEENDSILDCFGGSGSTLIACEQTGRRCYMMELDPHYADVIIERWEKFTGQKAELIKAAE